MTVAVDRFSVLIGDVIRNCGILELFTDNVIAAFAKDAALVPEIRTLTFSRRIRILRTLLLRENNRFDATWVNVLCDNLEQIAQERNNVAHNPVYADDEHGGNPRIIVRHKSKRARERQVFQPELETLRDETAKAIVEFMRHIPESKTIKE